MSLETMILQLFSSGCVAPSGNLDLPGVSGCGVQLGTITLSDIGGPHLVNSNHFRQGMAARLAMVRSHYDVPSLVFGRVPFGADTVDAAVFTVPAGGNVVQASQVSPFATLYATGRYSPGNHRVFEFAGGSVAMGDGQGGVAAAPVPFRLDSTHVDTGEVISVPLEQDDVSGGVLVRRPSGSAGVLVGLSAGRSYLTPPATRVVPLAVSGLVQLRVDAAGALPAGTPLTFSAPDTLMVARAGDLILARLAQPVAVAGMSTVFASVVYPPTPFASSGGGGGDATSIQGVSVDATAPVQGQVLAFDGTVWRPTSLGGAALPDVTAIVPPTSIYAVAASVKVAQAIRPTGGAMLLDGANCLWIAVANTNVMRVQVIRGSDSAVLVDETFVATGGTTATRYKHLFASPLAIPQSDTEEYFVCLYNTSASNFCYVGSFPAVSSNDILFGPGGVVSHLDWREAPATPTGVPNGSMVAIAPISPLARLLVA